VSTEANTSLTTGTNWYDLTPSLLLRGIGFSLTFVPIQTLAVATLTGATLAKASSLFSVGRQIFSSAGTATVITIFAQRTASRYHPIAGTPAQAHAAYAQAQTGAVNDIFRVVTIGAVIVLIVAAILTPGKKDVPERQRKRSIVSS